MKKQKASLCLQNHQSPPLHGAYIAGIVLYTLHVVTNTLIVTDPMIEYHPHFINEDTKE